MQHHIVRPRRQLLLAPLCALALSAGLVAPGHAHGPTRQKVVEKVTIDAPRRRGVGEDQELRRPEGLAPRRR